MRLVVPSSWRKPSNVGVGLLLLIFMAWSQELGLTTTTSSPSPTTTPPLILSSIPTTRTGTGVSGPRVTHFKPPYPLGISLVSVEAAAAAAMVTPPTWCSISALNGPGQMSPIEAGLLSRALSNASSYFEWGSGSSTIRALQSGVSEVTVVDTSKAALACLLHHPAASSSPGLHALFADVAGDDERAGNPKDRSLVQQWPAVSSAVLHHPNPLSLDVVLIDGRFRTAAAVKTACAVRDDTKILLHDWGRTKYHYGVKAGVLEVVETAGTLALLRRGAGAREIDAMEPSEALKAWKALWVPVEEDFE